MKFIIFLLIFTQLALGADYKDENFSLKLLKRSDKTILILEGLIRAPLALEFQKRIGELDVNLPLELRFDSVGGSIYETQNLIEVLDEMKKSGIRLITRVDQGSMCASSCVPLFVQGQTRVAGNASAFMFHGVALLLVTNIPSERETSRMIEIYRKAGIQEDWIQEHIDMNVWSRPNETWYNGKELFENGSNFVTDLLDNRIFFEPYDRDFSSRPR